MPTILKCGLILLVLTAAPAQSATTVTNVSADWHSLFLKSDGNLWGMGSNDAGELGDGTARVGNTVNSRSRPEQIVSNGVVSVSAGGSHTLFIKSDGSLWAMGGNSYGQLGNGTTNNIDRPEQIVSNGVVAVSAGAAHSLFLKSDGSLWGMGENDGGQLGDGLLSDNPPYGITRPELITSNNVVAIVAGTAQSLFLKSDGSLWGMGEVFGVMTVHPVQITPVGIVAIALGKHDSSILLKSDGSLWGMFNANPYPVLGSDGVQVTNVVAIAAGNAHSLFLKSDGSFWAFGYSDSGQLGTGSFANAYFPPQLIVSNGVIALAAGGQHSLFVKSDGTLWAMGDNTDGALGDGFEDRGSPVPEQIVPSPQPVLTVVRLVSKTNLQLQATCRFGGKYYLRSTTNLALPFSQWTTVATDSVQARGVDNFTTTITNAVNSSATRSFYILQSQ